MGRSFSRATPAATVADFYHQPSDSHYSMSVREGKYFQRRWQIGYDGREANVEDLPVDFVLGSGNHARTFLSRTAGGKLIELPLAWYAEKGGYWAMNPGYDTPHPPSNRPVAYECMFCHNAYPQIPAGHEKQGSEPVYYGAVPEGIDCQRCHGPGVKHIQAAASGKTGDIRSSIVNPARLDKGRQMEVCMQCHLETASTRLPSLIRRFGRGPFSYVAGQPLGDFVLSFDHAQGKGYDDKFDIAGGAYRLRQSQCFLKSKGELTCETCHNPHRPQHGPEASAAYQRVCRQCHAEIAQRAAAETHPQDTDCVTCHMPKRRTDDAVHVVMTDHRIQRPKAGADLLADKAESHPDALHEYQGEVAPYYPVPFPAGLEGSLYMALAQIQDGRNLQAGLDSLTRALTVAPAGKADFYMALGDGWHAAGRPDRSAPAYAEAARQKPDSARAWRYLGIALHESEKTERAIEALKRSIRLDATDAHSWLELGLTESNAGRRADGLRDLEKAAALDEALPDAWNALGVSRAAGGDGAGSEEALRKAIRIDPWYGAARANLARGLDAKGESSEAIYHFGKAASLDPLNGANHYEYALALVRLNRFEDSQWEAEAAVRASPGLAEAHELLGGLLARGSRMDAALGEFREAVRLRPEFSRAQLDLAATLAARGNREEAISHYREAAKGADSAVARAAEEALRRLGDVR